MPSLSCEPLLPNDSDALPRYRHAAPSGPWPWMDFSHADVTTASTAITTVATVATAVTNASIATEWSGYPQNRFGNWTTTQVERSQMFAKCSTNKPSKIYWMDVGDDGKFTTPDVIGDGHISMMTTTHPETFWKALREERSANIRVRSLFVDDLTQPVLQMLGTEYNIEPFFFTSSINRIPSRYQEAFSHGKGDHITITLPFIRTVESRSIPTDNHIDSQAPLPMHDGRILCMDLLAIHMIRDAKINTIISYHPESMGPWTSAERLHSLMLLVGHSVYWKHIFSTSTDPTFLFLAILWYPLYAWDESFESLHNHVSSLVPDILKSPADHSCYLQALQGRLLHYESLLDGYQASVSFIEKTPNPAVESLGTYEAQRKASHELMKKECENLLSEIDRLEKRRRTLKNRVKNLLDIVNSNQTKALIEVTDKGSETLTKITYLTMIFLPANLIASVFGMNVVEINPGSLETLNHYVETTIALTVFTFYIVVTLQTHTSFHEKGAKLQRRAAWPILLLWRAVERMKKFLVPQEKPKSV